jgi:hypothetical protein
MAMASFPAGLVLAGESALVAVLVGVLVAGIENPSFSWGKENERKVQSMHEQRDQNDDRDGDTEKQKKQ